MSVLRLCVFVLCDRAILVENSNDAKMKTKQYFAIASAENTDLVLSADDAFQLLRRLHVCLLLSV